MLYLFNFRTSSVIKLLLDNGVNLKAKNSEGITTLGLIIKDIYTDKDTLEDKKEKMRKIIESISLFRTIELTDIEETDQSLKQASGLNEEIIDNATYFLKLTRYRFAD